jgi:hypothetical protein
MSQIPDARVHPQQHDEKWYRSARRVVEAAAAVAGIDTTATVVAVAAAAGISALDATAAGCVLSTGILLSSPIIVGVCVSVAS